MSIIRQKKRCLNCGRMYDFNPDAGKWICPFCSVITKEDGSLDSGKQIILRGPYCTGKNQQKKRAGGDAGKC